MKSSKEAKRGYDAGYRTRQKAQEGETEFLARMAEKQRLGDARRGPVPVMLVHAKRRASRDGVPFDLKKDDVQIPTHCPILGMKLGKGSGHHALNSPSLDRIVSSRGYVKDNVAVISHKANRLKGEATADEHILIANWIRRNTSETDTTTGYLSHKY